MHATRSLSRHEVDVCVNIMAYKSCTLKLDRRSVTTSCPNRLHHHSWPDSRPTAKQRPTPCGTRGRCARSTWIRVSWAWWSTIGPTLFCWWSSPCRPSGTAGPKPVEWPSSPSWRPPSSSFPWSSSFCLYLCIEKTPTN